MLKKITTGFLCGLLTILLTMPLVSAWSSYASVSLPYGQASVTSGEVGLSKSAYYEGENTTTSDQGFSVDFRCMAAYYTSLYTVEHTFQIEKHGPKKGWYEHQDISSKFKLRVQSGGMCKETARGSVELQ